MDNLFERAIVFSDLHLGLKNNSKEHNVDCTKYIDWLIKENKTLKAETLLFLGDFHHVRNAIYTSTLDYSIRILRKLSKNFKDVYFLVGNHDMHFRDKRDITSLEFLREYPNIHLIDEPTEVGNCLLLPWLIDDEWKEVPKSESKYVFGHLELPDFFLNAKIVMSDKGELNSKLLMNPDYVFSGHFHKRQKKDKVVYIGNAFPHNYADIGDENERGFMFLKWDEEPRFHTWPETPKYMNASLVYILNNLGMLDSKTFLKIQIPSDINALDVAYVKETLLSYFKLREASLVFTNDVYDSIEGTIDDMDNEEFESIDDIIITLLRHVESSTLDTEMLVDLYGML
jgi:DNA repair exonuclease SbcCD nuclease subunit